MADQTPTTLNCPACGAPLEYDGTSAVSRCKFCGNVSLIPGARSSAPSGSAAALDEIRRLAQGGNLIGAIKKYRQIYGVDLREAKEAVEALEAGRLASPAAPGMPSPSTLTHAMEQVRRRIAAGDKIGAIKIYRENYDVSLTRAKDAIEKIEAGQSINPESSFEAIRAVLEPQATVRSRKWLGWVVTLAVILAVGGLLWLILSQPGGPLNPHYYPNDKALLLPGESGASPELAVWFYDAAADNRFIGQVNAESGKLTWKAVPLAGDGFIDAIAASFDMVYAANGTDLLAYRRTDGSLAWQAKMTDKLNYARTALLINPVRVVTNNADQTIQAYNADNGSPVWSMRLSGYDRGLHPVGKSLMVIDYVGENNLYGLIFLDLFSGVQQNTVFPSCTYNDYESTIDPDSGLVYDSAENALYLVYDSSYGCVQRIDPASGEVVWSTAVKDSFSFQPDGFQYLLTSSTLYFSAGNSIMAVDKSSGEMKALFSDADYDFVPLTMSGSELLVRARRTRGTEKFELWGIAAASGKTSWKIDLYAAKPIDPPNVMVGLVDKTDWGWTWKLTPAGLVLLKFQGQPNQLIYEIYNPASGKSQSGQIFPLKNVSGDFYDIPTVIGEQGNLLYLNIEQNIFSLDLASARLRRIY